ncbi:DUF4192 domain-containing protein [Streptomyces sp. NBC_00820]|uniref:DUF4192 domain-containing protein n=1 Tax=Streptomyces sp. NBC_00820 TaxID=2975842 RepID=UPI002ED1619D|nr:DUF4192 domain-containing protein [Streptomyces sp. NBC_00820]
MTNHGETTGPFENGDITGGIPLDGRSAHDAQVTLRTPAELADALPYLLGYRPEDSIVLVALHDRGGRGRFGGRARLGIPAGEDDWAAAARQLARGLVTGSERRGARPEQMVAYVCQEPRPGESGQDVKRRLGPLAQLLRTECGSLDVPVIETLCISDRRFWSYSCPVVGCCPEEGTPMGLPGTSVLAAAATYAGIQVRGTLRELRARMLPWETSAALAQEVALDTAGMALVPRILDDARRADVASETLGLAERVIRRFAAAPPVSGTHVADARDDALLAHDEAATLILGLQDRTTRDRAAGWMEGDEAGPALRLWRALARRCVGPYGEHAAAPLTLAGWVAWSAGDELEAREALAMALGADPDYLFARLLHQACNEGLDPEAVRRCLRADRTGRTLGGDMEEQGMEEQDTEEQGEEDRDTEERDRDPEQTGPASGPDRSSDIRAAAAGAPGHGTAAAATGQAECRGGEPAGGADDGEPARDTGDEPEDGAGAASGSRTAPRRRRRARPSDTCDSGARPARAEGRRRRPAHSRPQPPATGPAYPGSARPGGTRTRADDGTGGATKAETGRHAAESDG